MVSLPMRQRNARIYEVTLVPDAGMRDLPRPHRTGDPSMGMSALSRLNHKIYSTAATLQRRQTDVSS